MNKEWHPIETTPIGEKVLVTRLPYDGHPAPVQIATYSKSSFERGFPPWKITQNRYLKWKPTHWSAITYPEKSGLNNGER